MNKYVPDLFIVIIFNLPCRHHCHGGWHRICKCPFVATCSKQISFFVDWRIWIIINFSTHIMIHSGLKKYINKINTLPNFSLLKSLFFKKGTESKYLSYFSAKYWASNWLTNWVNQSETSFLVRNGLKIFALRLCPQKTVTLTSFAHNNFFLLFYLFWIMHPTST